MTRTCSFLLTILATITLGVSAQAAPQNGKYRCKKNAGGVCAQRISTGQCTHQWDQDEHNNPMFHCKKFIGIKVSNYNPKNYYCKQMGDSVCAASKRHGQCTHVWSYEDGADAMWQCRRHLGLVKSSFDKSKFRCKNMGDSACAQSKRTGQCTHRWTKDDHHNPYRACLRWLRK